MARAVMEGVEAGLKWVPVGRRIARSRICAKGCGLTARIAYWFDGEQVVRTGGGLALRAQWDSRFRLSIDHGG